MDELTKLLEDATSGIDHSYFQIQIDGGDPVYRERVYCYELYHQLRRLWPPTTPYYLNGELDKSAHPILTGLGAGHAKPDLLVHRPGFMDGNDTIIEVKSSRAPIRGIKKDLQTLSLFRSKVGYRRAIYLIFGNETASAVNRVCRVAEDLAGLPSIELWVHAAARERATYNQAL